MVVTFGMSWNDPLLFDAHRAWMSKAFLLSPRMVPAN